ncbi:MAG TPA: hypothetical protein VNR87_00860 [Flavisolibacter sp.]|nr:hypothetical protein [Flavisolibacter sp.]
MPSNAGSASELLIEAREAEENNDWENAAKLYQRAIKKQPHLEEAFARLMVIYRKQKNYEAELDVINKGIRAFEEFYRKRAEKFIGNDKQAQRLSTALARSLGQSGKTTSELLYPEPIPKWLKRQQVVEKKLGKK